MPFQPYTQLTVNIVNDDDVSLDSGDPSTTFSGADLLERSPNHGLFNPNDAPRWKVRDDYTVGESLDVYLDFALDLEAGVYERVINAVVLVGLHGDSGNEHQSEDIEVWVMTQGGS